MRRRSEVSSLNLIRNTWVNSISSPKDVVKVEEDFLEYEYDYVSIKIITYA